MGTPTHEHPFSHKPGYFSSLLNCDSRLRGHEAYKHFVRRRLLGDFGEEDPLVASEDSIGNLKIEREENIFY